MDANHGWTARSVGCHELSEADPEPRVDLVVLNTPLEDPVPGMAFQAIGFRGVSR